VRHVGHLPRIIATAMFECPRRAESNLIPEQLEDNSVVKHLFLYVINKKHTIALARFVSMGGLIT
jgi:hypothetical protein